MVTFGYPVGTEDQINRPYLVVDLHALNKRGYEQMVEFMKQQVKQTNYEQGNIVNGWSVWLFSVTLDAADWLPGLLKDVKSISQLVPRH